MEGNAVVVVDVGHFGHDPVESLSGIGSQSIKDVAIGNSGVVSQHGPKEEDPVA